LRICRKRRRKKESKRIDETKGTEKIKSVHSTLTARHRFSDVGTIWKFFCKTLSYSPEIKGWRLKAGILHKGYQGKRILEFSLDGSEEASGHTRSCRLSEEFLQTFSLPKKRKGIKQELEPEPGTGQGLQKRKPELRKQKQMLKVKLLTALMSSSLQT
jgi:hypothetical protein